MDGSRTARCRLGMLAFVLLTATGVPGAAAAPDAEAREIALVIDASHRMGWWPLVEAMNGLLDGLPPTSCVLLLPVSTTTRQGVWGHPGDPVIRAALDRVEFTGRELTLDALAAAYEILGARDASVASADPGFDIQGDCAAPATEADARPIRRLVGAISYGEHHENRAGLDDVLRATSGTAIPLVALSVFELQGTGDHLIRGRRPQRGHVRDMKALAEHTGGVVLRAMPQRGDGVFEDAVQRLAASLRDY